MGSYSQLLKTINTNSLPEMKIQTYLEFFKDASFLHEHARIVWQTEEVDRFPKSYVMFFVVHYSNAIIWWIYKIKMIRKSYINDICTKLISFFQVLNAIKEKIKYREKLERFFTAMALIGGKYSRKLTTIKENIETALYFCVKLSFVLADKQMRHLLKSFIK